MHAEVRRLTGSFSLSVVWVPGIELRVGSKTLSP